MIALACVIAALAAVIALAGVIAAVPAVPAVPALPALAGVIALADRRRTRRRGYLARARLSSVAPCVSGLG
ncbi:hypothetical protein AB0C12_14440 [Actinoplanes sp. NPDC048967]|uniref:hypothetical protein n=1 Tax=Actinoplanes sp. NPDC048967 TaxID=3155269 RepID=UPI00340D2554